MTGDDRKNKSGPQRDELSVGLSRNAAPQSRRVPRWFTEFGGWIFASSLLVMALVTLLVLMQQDAKDKLLIGDSLASLMVVGTPLKVWEEGSVTKVKSVQVRVGNEGPHAAENVQVAVVSGSNRIVLPGPKQIQSGKSAVFSGDTQLVLRQGQEVQLSLECSNCR